MGSSRKAARLTNGGRNYPALPPSAYTRRDLSLPDQPSNMTGRLGVRRGRDEEGEAIEPEDASEEEPSLPEEVYEEEEVEELKEVEDEPMVPEEATVELEPWVPEEEDEGQQLEEVEDVPMVPEEATDGGGGEDAGGGR